MPVFKLNLNTGYEHEMCKYLADFWREKIKNIKTVFTIGASKSQIKVKRRSKLSLEKQRPTKVICAQGRGKQKIHS